MGRDNYLIHMAMGIYGKGTKYLISSNRQTKKALNTYKQLFNTYGNGYIWERVYMGKEQSI
jgi:hypothetical protein